MHYILMADIDMGGDMTMYQVSEFKKNVCRVKETADIPGVAAKTIRNYDRDGKIKTTPTNSVQPLHLFVHGWDFHSKL